MSGDKYSLVSVYVCVRKRKRENEIEKEMQCVEGGVRKEKAEEEEIKSGNLRQIWTLKSR